MIIKKLELAGDEVLVDIEGRDDITLAFKLQDVPDANILILKIKAKLAKIDSEPGVPPAKDWKPFFKVLRSALEGKNIGD